MTISRVEALARWNKLNDEERHQLHRYATTMTFVLVGKVPTFSFELFRTSSSAIQQALNSRDAAQKFLNSLPAPAA